MLTKLEQATQKWGGVNSLIDQWLDNRGKLLVTYCKLAGLSPYTPDEKTLPTMDSIRSFCIQLMDYVSEGHFEVYNQLIDSYDDESNNCQINSQQIIEKISVTTDLILDFNDKHTEANPDAILVQLDNDLSTLGQTLEARFALEDKLLERLHSTSMVK